MTLFRWPRTLAARTALVVMLVLTLVQMGGLTIYALDRMVVRRSGAARAVGTAGITEYRSVVRAPVDRRPYLMAGLAADDGGTSSLADHPDSVNSEPAPGWMRREVIAGMALVPLAASLRPTEMVVRLDRPRHQVALWLRLPDGSWLGQRIVLPAIDPWRPMPFLLGFLLMTAAAAVMIHWAVRRLTRPVAALAAAAAELGRDVYAPPLPESGPAEIAAAAAAFNTMAERIRRFVQDRTVLLAAIGHDLRTPLTRLRLRTEFIEPSLQRDRMLSDLDELETMVAATLDFGRDAATREAVRPVDLVALARTVLDEVGDARPAVAERLRYSGPDRLVVQARPAALKRALHNLVANAANYGGNAHVAVDQPEAPDGGRTVSLTVEDDGPGIPPEALDLVFQPFQRLDSSRNRETGGIGLGLSIARNIMRAHGGDVTLANRGTGGARATMLLPQ